MVPADANESKRPRVAAIDIGTNSIRLIVAEFDPELGYRLLDDEKEVARLGAGLAHTGTLDADAMEHSAVVISRMRAIAEGYNVDVLRAIATCAVREAENGAAFVALVRERAGVDIEVISAEEEARLAYSSVAHAFDLRDVTAAIADIGGGSTEIVLSVGGVIEQICPTRLGAVRLTEQFGIADGVDGERFRALERRIREKLRRRLGRLPFTPQMLIGTGGTFTTMAGIAVLRGASRDEQEMLGSTIRGYEMQRADVRHMLEWLRSMPLRERKRVSGLSVDRAEIIVAGIAVVDGIMAHLKVNTLRVHDRGIRDGVILRTLETLVPTPARPVDGAVEHLRGVRQFARACRYEAGHAEHVAGLAVSVFDQLATIDGLAAEWATPANRDLLEAAAVLHDVGYYINYDKHHKHSYHLIMHSDLAGFTRREREIIANVARYHRKAAPKSAHANYRRLDEADQTLVRRLSGILRLTDGLDRAHAQRVTAVRLRRRDDVLECAASAPEMPEVDLWGADRKRKLFEQAFDVRVRLRWARPRKAASTAGDRETG